MAHNMTNLLRGNWTDTPCWYVSAQDAGRTALVLGPFPTESSCREWAYRDTDDGGSFKHTKLVDEATRRDPKSWFYAWGMVKTENGHRDGCMNRFMPEADVDAVRAVVACKEVA